MTAHHFVARNHLYIIIHLDNMKLTYPDQPLCHLLFSAYYCGEWEAEHTVPVLIDTNNVISSPQQPNTPGIQSTNQRVWPRVLLHCPITDDHKAVIVSRGCLPLKVNRRWDWVFRRRGGGGGEEDLYSKLFCPVFSGIVECWKVFFSSSFFGRVRGKGRKS